MSLPCIQFIVAERGESAATFPALSLSRRSTECQMFETLLDATKDTLYFPSIHPRKFT
jgi:hypothetical protein